MVLLTDKYITPALPKRQYAQKIQYRGSPEVNEIAIC